MDIDYLVRQITDIVMDRLSPAGDALPPRSEPTGASIEMRGSASSPQEVSAARIFKGVVVLTEKREQMEEFWEQMRVCASLPIEWLVFTSPDFPLSFVRGSLQPLKMQCFDSFPSRGQNIAASSDFLVIPVITLSLCAKVANLISDDIPSRLVLQFLIERKQIIAGAEEMNFLTRFSAQLPKPLVNVMNTNFETIRAMGLIETEMKSIEQEIKAVIARTGTCGKGHNVITKEDIVAAMEEGKMRLEFLRGTIITPLARAYAEEMKVEIVLR